MSNFKKIAASLLVLGSFIVGNGALAVEPTVVEYEPPKPGNGKPRGETPGAGTRNTEDETATEPTTSFEFEVAEGTTCSGTEKLSGCSTTTGDDGKTFCWCPGVRPGIPNGNPEMMTMVPNYSQGLFVVQ